MKPKRRGLPGSGASMAITRATGFGDNKLNVLPASRIFEYRRE
ncbi:hypothetical protein [Marinimicrobium locisalis]